MTIDVTPLAWMTRRMDVSATLKSFFAVIAFLLVLRNLGRIHAFALQVIRSGLVESEDSGLLLAVFATLVVVSFGPLAFIVWDWAARRPWRHLAAINGALIGALGCALIGAFIAAPIVLFVEEPEAGWIHLLVVPLVGFAALLAAPFVRSDSQFTTSDHVAFLGVLLAVGFLAWLFIRAVRHRIVLSGDRPRELLLGALHRGSFWARLAFLAGLPSSLWHLSALRTPAFWAFLVARPLVYAGLMVFSRLGQGLATAGVAGAAALVVAGHLLFHLGKRLAARDIWRPERPGAATPVLFLRSFRDDQLDFKRPWWALSDRWFDLWSFRHNLDQMMVDEVAQYGPVVALGNPGEESVPFGASRHYATHDSWQRIIEDTASRAHAIVMAAGSSPGLRWEYELLARRGLLERTLLLFPPTGGDAAAAGAALSLFQEATGTSHEFEIPRDRQPIALLHTDAGPSLLTARRASASAYVVAVRAHFQGSTAEQLADRLTL